MGVKCEKGETKKEERTGEELETSPIGLTSVTQKALKRKEIG